MVAVLLSAFAIANAAEKKHKDYVPDEKTAERIADAALLRITERIRLRRSDRFWSTGRIKISG
jgi:hypothetical protein